MTDYISREEAIKNLREVYEHEYPTASGEFDEYASHDVPNVLRNMKSSDAQPVLRGKWQGANEMPYDDIMVCSECKHEAYWDTDYGQQLFDFCPYCGARMDGDTE